MRSVKKNIGKPLLTGLAISAILVIIMLFLTMNFQIILVLGVFFYWIGGFVNRHSTLPKVLIWLAIVWSFLLLFAVLVLTEIPTLYYIPMLWAVACILGLTFDRFKIASKILTIVFVCIVVFFGWIVMPDDLHKSLTNEINQPLPTFQIENMDGLKVSNADFRNKIVVIDFFGTWCKPCIEELKELHKVQLEFKDDPDIAFYVVNADMGGDTTEKFKRFIENNEYSFNYLYDDDSSFFKSLQLQTSGLPCLLIVDTLGVVRWKHIGYNKAETSFTKNLISYLKELRRSQ